MFPPLKNRQKAVLPAGPIGRGLRSEVMEGADIRADKTEALDDELIAIVQYIIAISLFCLFMSVHQPNCTTQSLLFKTILLPQLKHPSSAQKSRAPNYQRVKNSVNCRIL